MTDRFSGAEQAVVAALVADPTRVAEVWGELQPEDFTSRVYRDAYETIGRLSRDGKPVDIIILKHHGIEFPDGFMDVYSRSSNDLTGYIEIIREGSFRRAVYDHAERVMDLAWSNTHDRDDILGALSAFKFEASELRDGTLYTHERAAQKYHATLDLRKSGDIGLRYGFREMDETLQPAIGGDMIVVAARPSVGKTTFAENVCDNWSLSARYPVLFVSAEMRLSQLMDRAISRMTGIPNQRLLRGDLDENETLLVDEAIESRKDFNIVYVDDGQATSASIRHMAAKVSSAYGGLTAIVVDYLQLLSDKGDSQVQKVTNISNAMKGIAREYDVPLMVLSQLNRAGQFRKDPRPILSDLRDSGAIEQDADLVFGLHSDPEFREDPLEVIVLKNRQGDAHHTIELDFDRAHARIK